MSKMIKNRKTSFWVLLFSVATVFCIHSNAVAQTGSFYIGASVGVDRTDVEHKKTVDNTNTPSNFLESGNVYNTIDSAAEMGLSGGLLIGYRLNLDPSGTFYLSAEIDGQFHGGATGGMLPGVGNQYGQAWPDDWSVDRKNSYGTTVIFGANPPFLISFLGPGAGIYALGGYRLVDAELKVHYNGCLIADKICGPGEFTSGTDFHDETFHAWTAGAGLEKIIGGKIGVRGEVRYTQYGKENRETFSEENVRVPISLDGSEVGFSIKTVLYF